MLNLRNRKVSLSLLTAVLLFTAAAAVFFTNVAAQTTDPLPLPSDSTDLTSLFLGDPATYNIVYLVDSKAMTDESLISPNNSLGEVMKATALSTWEDVIRYDAEQPIQALVIHESAYSTIDREWVEKAWRGGVTIATINVSFAEFAELRNYECARQKAVNYKSPFTGDFYYMAAQIIIAKNSDEQGLVEDQILGNCNNDHGIGSYTRYKSGAGAFGREEDVYYFTAKLIGGIEAVKETKHNFDNRFSPTMVPTFVPENNN